MKVDVNGVFNHDQTFDDQGVSKNRINTIKNTKLENNNNKGFSGGAINTYSLQLLDFVIQYGEEYKLV